MDKVQNAYYNEEVTLPSDSKGLSFLLCPHHSALLDSLFAREEKGKEMYFASIVQLSLFQSREFINS